MKEQLLWVHTFDTVEVLRQALLEFNEKAVLTHAGSVSPASTNSIPNNIPKSP